MKIYPAPNCLLHAVRCTWGNFNQGGDRTSFASSENFVIAFIGSGQRAYFDDDKDSGFANIDSAHDSVRIVDYPMVLEDSMSFRICRGILIGLQDDQQPG